LSTNVPLKDAINIFTNTNTFDIGSLLLSGERAGYLGYPFDDDSPHTADYTLEAEDEGKCIFFSSAHGAGDTVTIPSNASGTFANLGVTILIVNDSDTDDLEVAIDTDTLYLAGTTTTGPQNIKPKGMALIYRTQTVEWIIAPLGDSIDYPAGQQTLYSSFCDGSAGAGVTIKNNTAATGWTVARIIAGQFRVTHNQGLASVTDLSIIAQIVSAAPDDRFIHVSPGLNSFDLFIEDSGAGAVDADFFFQASRLV
jgi:hypothetical protein